MILREAIQQVNGFRYMMDQLNIRSALGRRFLYDLPWLNSKTELEAEFRRVRETCGLLKQAENAALLEQIGNKLMQVRDIRGTVLRTGTDAVLDDLELFELKIFALLADDIRKIADGWRVVDVPDLKPVIDLLDPEGNRIPHFYIYDVYSPELAALRAEIKQKRQEGEKEQELEILFFRSVELEDGVRESLSKQLKSFHRALQGALEAVALLDVVMAKAEQAEEMQLVCPEIREENIGRVVFRGLFHPRLKEILRREGKKFQAVDLELGLEATVITGANMAGKTVLLKSVELAQYLLQFGFYVPAWSAEMILVDRVQTSIGDDQDELNGLSSFAAEMLRVNGIVEQINNDRKVLVLIDELARTTNPVEGGAIVNGVVDFLSAHQVMSLITTHYSGITAKCRKLRVKGFVENRINGDMTLKNINEFIDYSLEEDIRDEVPHEAMRIAWMLGVDNGLLAKIESYLQEEILI